MQPGKDLLVISQKGISKRTPFSEYRITNRGGVGIKTMALSDKTGDVVDAKAVDKDDRLLIMTRTPSPSACAWTTFAHRDVLRRGSKPSI